MSTHRGRCGSLYVLAWLLATAFSPGVLAGCITPSSVGLRSTRYSIDQGQPVVTETSQTGLADAFRVECTIDGRWPIGREVDVAAVFRISEIDPGAPVMLQILAHDAWGYSGQATMNLEGYSSNGTVTIDDFHSPVVPPVGFEDQLNVAMGDYSGSPLLFEYDITSFVASIRESGYDHAGLRFMFDGLAHPAFVTMSDLMLRTGADLVPEPSSLSLILVVLACLGCVIVARTRAT
jgi:hypothetical protein